MLLEKIIEVIEKEFPLETAYEWDNVGLLAGDKNQDVKKVLITLDVTPFVVGEAISLGADLIFSHHPIMFGGIKKITRDSTDGKILISCIENGISIYAAHTNCDVGIKGINAGLAELFGLSNVEYIEETGLGRIGDLEKEIPFTAFCDMVKEKLNTPNIRVCGDTKKGVKRLAVGGGACWDLVEKARSMGADTMITADLKYHQMIEFAENGIRAIDAGHYPTEIIALSIFRKLLSGLDVEIVESTNKDVVKFM